MHFESRFVVSGTPDVLIERFADVLPGIVRSVRARLGVTDL